MNMLSLLSRPVRTAAEPVPARCAAPEAAGFQVTVINQHLPATSARVALGLRQRPRDSNRQGQRAGWVLREGRERAALFDGDRVVDVGLLHGHDHCSRATAVNDCAQVVGMSCRGRHEHAFFWHAGFISALGGLCSTPGRTHGSHYSSSPRLLQASRAHAINCLGQVVGRAATEERVFGFLWSFWSGLLDLSHLQAEAHTCTHDAWQIVDALHIDDQGHILATGARGGCYHDVLLTPLR
jgi:probable HAF family extracellular repeat protein